ncbi:MAG TPA: isoleucine--tRNA ligase [Candidatus Dormibacteraeota bacterium]|jgi:isoleucyl-tRNA synthetase|nr:isoleucine--tRNA ligase [Candidatus Dormibacteraeota bacterium]
MQTRKTFEEVTARPDLPALERQIVERWEREGTFEESLARRRGGPRFVFYEGPPTANGMPGTHHVEARAFKDLFPRYRTMKGDFVERKAGWDTHGLPVELEVEKQLGISGKQQIEEFGIERFNQLCRQSVYRYVDAWTRFSRRMAFWQDYEHAYWTLTSEYIQSVWWALKTMWDRGLVYQDFRVAPYCPRCMTPLSSHELAQGWQDDTPDPSVFVRFRLRDDPGASFLAWTTTPWTLPGNVALAVGEDLDYVRVRQGDEDLILAEARLEVLTGPYQVVERLKGADLVGREYEPVFSYLRDWMGPDPRAWRVVAADFVSIEEGTGIVHTAAAYGADDLRLCREKGIPFRHTVDLRGRFVPEVEKFAGMFVKEADARIVDDLRERGLLYRSGQIRHTYPFCWRCRTPLLYYALDSWYVRTTAVKSELLANNLATNWVPAHVRKGRMGDWLENNVDWAISRTRYWGTPLPFWICDACGARRCVGSAEELGLPPDADLHRPYIDQVKLPCPSCGGQMSRVPEVLDVWFDSGSMPFAQRGYPHRGEEEFRASFPADFICEAIDQTRGWFYSLLAISTILFGRNAYRNVICLGLLLDTQGRKQSKSRGNVLDPEYLFETYGADAVRWFFYTSTSVGENYRAGETAFKEIVRRFLLTLWNVYHFFVTYANVDGFEPGREAPVPLDRRPVLDRWLLSRLSHLVETVDRALERYDVTGAARPIEAFVDDLSNWYVRRSRRRFWKSGSDLDKLAAHQTLYQTLVTLARLLAPFTPFISEAIHRNLCQDESVHLAAWPAADPEARDLELEQEMAEAREAVQAGLAARDAARIRVRQPLPSLTVTRAFRPEVATIICEELNVKELRVGPAFSLDTTVTEELRFEGLAREAVRQVQDLRKRTGLAVDDRIRLYYQARGAWARALERFAGYVAAETLATILSPERPDGLDGVRVDDDLWIGLERSA